MFSPTTFSLNRFIYISCLKSSTRVIINFIIIFFNKKIKINKNRKHRPTTVSLIIYSLSSLFNKLPSLLLLCDYVFFSIFLNICCSFCKLNLQHLFLYYNRNWGSLLTVLLLLWWR